MNTCKWCQERKQIVHVYNNFMQPISGRGESVTNVWRQLFWAPVLKCFLPLLRDVFLFRSSDLKLRNSRAMNYPLKLYSEHAYCSARNSMAISGCPQVLYVNTRGKKVCAKYKNGTNTELFSTVLPAWEHSTTKKDFSRYGSGGREFVLRNPVCVSTSCQVRHPTFLIPCLQQYQHETAIQFTVQFLPRETILDLLTRTLVLL